MDIAAFVSKWHLASGGERKAKDYFLLDLCAALGVPPPEVGQDRYGFEADVLQVNEGGKITTLRVDLYKHGCFILEAKQGSNPGDAKAGHGKRGSEAWNASMQNALGQAIGYARSMNEPPPFLVVCDIGYMFELYADFDHSGFYRPFPNAQKHRRFLIDLEVHAKDLRALFLDPLSLDPARVGIKVTREIAEDLAQLAKLLEAKKHPPTLIAKFLMRCLFTMFAEDVDLLPDDMFTNLLRKKWTKKPETFVGGVEQLWRTMNAGGYYGSDEVRNFNGGLFEDPVAFQLDEAGLKILLRAAEREWADVEPSIFGTLLERALDPKERHKLGAHFTPRAYVERLVRPTIEEPLRIEWENAQALSVKLRADGKLDGAREIVHAFHQKLCATRVLDPACGSGNFLYVTLNILKQIESEVLALLVDMGEKQEQLIRITPGNFRGIEVKPWGKEIAELVLWIGYLQWHYRSHGKGMPPPSPVLQDYENIECRDAVLAWDKIELVRDDKGKPVTRWDGETRKKNLLTGKMIPDDNARVVSYNYVNPKKAEWPKADYVVGNPPFVANKNMRSFLGEGYVGALRAAYNDIKEAADYVMVFWARAAEHVASGSIQRAGLITTNSIRMIQNQGIVQRALSGGCRLLFAIPDHPWPSAASNAEVRISMTVLGSSATIGPSRLVLTRTHDKVARGKDLSTVVNEKDLVIKILEMIPPDLSPLTDVSLVAELRSNGVLTSAGVKPYSESLVITREQAEQFFADPSLRKRHAPECRNGKDVGQQPRHAHVLDFFGLAEAELQEKFPVVYQYLLDTAKEERAGERNPRLKNEWWLFEANRPEMRRGILAIPRYLVTVESSPVRAFVFLDSSILPDQKLRVIATDDAFVLGVLSSRLHLIFAHRVGGRQGVRNTPVYNTRCFGRFPFPHSTEVQKKRIRVLGEQLDAHRKRQQAAYPDLTMTGMYNVLEKLRASAELTDQDRVIHEHGLVSILKKIHDDLDLAVFEAYGWPPDLTDEQILEKLVALNAERAKEEEKGIIRWLRPDFQNPSGQKAATQSDLPTGKDDEAAQSAPAPAVIKRWPKKLAEQIAAIRDRVAFPGMLFTVKSVAAAFKGAKKKDIEGFLDGFAALGVLTVYEGPAGKRWRAAGRTA